MAGNGKKILMFDESGMLSKDILLGYIHGELSPSVREEVEKHIAADEFYQDVIEGLKQVPEKGKIEKVVNNLNEAVAQRSGSEVKATPGLAIGDFLNEYKNIAAVILGVVLLAGIVATVMLVRDTNAPVAKNEERFEAPMKAEEKLEPMADGESVVTEPAEEAEMSVDTLAGFVAVAEDEIVDGVSNDITISGNSQKKEPSAKQTPGGAVPKASESVTGATKPAPVTENKNSKKESNADDDKIESSTSAQNGPAVSDIINASDATRMSYVTTPTTSEKPASRKSQSDKSKSTEITLQEEAITVADEMPQYPGGEVAMRQYIRDNIQYPKKAREDGIQGKVYLSFTVGSSGRIKDIRVVQGVNKEINAEAIRLISNMPSWTPGKKDGQAIAVKQYLPIEFSITANQ